MNPTPLAADAIPAQRTGAVFVMGLIVSAMALAVLAYQAAVTVPVFSGWQDRLSRKPVLTIIVLSAPVLLLLFLPMIAISTSRLRMKTSGFNPQRTLRDLRRVRIATAIVLCDSLLELAVMDGPALSLANLECLTLQIGFCVSLAFLLSASRVAIGHMSPGKTANTLRRGFMVLTPSAQPALADADDAVDEEGDAPAWRGMVMLLAVAMGLAYCGDAADLVRGLVQNTGPASYSLMPLPSSFVASSASAAASTDELSRDAALALGACGVFWTAWMVACLAAGARWRRTAFACAIITLAVHLGVIAIKASLMARSWQFYSPYNSIGPQPPGEGILILLRDLALPIVLLVLLCKREVIAAMKRR